MSRRWVVSATDSRPSGFVEAAETARLLWTRHAEGRCVEDCFGSFSSFTPTCGEFGKVTLTLVLEHNEETSARGCFGSTGQVDWRCERTQESRLAWRILTERRPHAVASAAAGEQLNEERAHKGHLILANNRARRSAGERLFRQQ
jgi:hypothetical protein